MYESMKKSQKKYYKKFDRALVYLPLGASKIIRREGYSVNGLVNELLRAWADLQGVADYPIIAKRIEDTRRAGVIAETVAAVVLPDGVDKEPAKLRPVTLDDFLL